MMKGLLFQQPQQALEENMSNLTSASAEASVSSGSRLDIAPSYPPQQYFAPPPQTQPAKKKRNLPGNPDPDAEVVALSPKTLLATNRFICEICNKGFQRDQNLQLHRRGHNLPWKLKQRTSKEVRKKVYVCPEPSCVHHDPSRALGDLTGIKKHFCRKHGEKKWKCDKCSKRYAVQSDWKAHSKTCGTREYRCDCGTLFSRRDSFITHRAFCDALAEESARAITANNPLLSSQQLGSSAQHLDLQAQFNPQGLHEFSLKKEQQNIALRPDIPQWLSPPVDLSCSSSSNPIFSTRLDQEFPQTQTQTHQDLALHEPQKPNPSPNMGPTNILPPYHTTPSPHISATALLQKAAQMGATMSTKSASQPAMLRSHSQAHVSTTTADSGSNTDGTFGFNLSSREEMASGFVRSLPSYGNKAVVASAPVSSGVPQSLQGMMDSLSSASGFQGSSFEEAFDGILNSRKDGNVQNAGNIAQFSKTDESGGGGGGGSGGGGGGEGLTRDFLGLRAISQSDLFNIAGFGNCMTSQNQPNQSQKPWQG